MELTFVAGTGRRGSTLLSRIMARHPDVLSLSEFFGILRLAGATGRAKIPAGDMTGADLWELLSRPFPLLDAMVTAGLRTAEMIYPFGRGRFDPATGIPLISHFTLPMLTKEPDELFGALAAEVPRWPRRPAAGQYEALFARLTGVAEFIGVSAPRDWLDQATAMIDPAGTGNAEAELDPAAYAALREACEPGTRALREGAP